MVFRLGSNTSKWRLTPLDTVSADISQVEASCWTTQGDVDLFGQYLNRLVSELALVLRGFESWST